MFYCTAAQGFEPLVFSILRNIGCLENNGGAHVFEIRGSAKVEIQPDRTSLKAFKWAKDVDENGLARDSTKWAVYLVREGMGKKSYSRKLNKLDFKAIESEVASRYKKKPDQKSIMESFSAPLFAPDKVTKVKKENNNNDQSAYDKVLSEKNKKRVIHFMTSEEQGTFATLIHRVAGIKRSEERCRLHRLYLARGNTPPGYKCDDSDKPLWHICKSIDIMYIFTDKPVDASHINESLISKNIMPHVNGMLHNQNLMLNMFIMLMLKDLDSGINVQDQKKSKHLYLIYTRDHSAHECRVVEVKVNRVEGDCGDEQDLPVQFVDIDERELVYPEGCTNFTITVPSGQNAKDPIGISVSNIIKEWWKKKSK